MNTFELKIWDDEAQKCSFYTVQWEDAKVTETDKFFAQYEDENHPMNDAANIVLSLVLDAIGDKYGATDDFFDRTKNKAQALPPKPKRRIAEIEEIGINFPLRLYCYRVSESIVVLFNGGIKDEHSDQKSEDIRFKFYEAQTFATRIEEALNEGMIIKAPDKRTLTDFNGKTELFL